MSAKPVLIYFVIMNSLAFAIFWGDINRDHRVGKGVEPQILLKLVTIFGGALGSLVAQMVFDLACHKWPLVNRFYSLLWVVIQTVVLSTFVGPYRFFLQAYFSQYRLWLIYLALLNSMTFLVYGMDKFKAVSRKWRIRESYLLVLAIAGGAIGALMGMDLFHHKVNKPKFYLGVPAILALQVLICYYLKENPMTF
ncbi:Uncharacterized membrane protein YsdA, DUF1294 family [Granulicatella balaenopterae]|uniref:Uncharacterized membrane protein YsdA, DUF1294 family n=1 Tax=Granulicatella balaenopterae TaxID=137733 RepID=A0A1H9IZ61_9LACT|nr:DUF1294 domain-containing protein [Granulicatella balaenopterae]SEQ80091.1 Uncharacterized membrane protein YsdA, DUF1294 family [Granulicatella balaenopterae]